MYRLGKYCSEGNIKNNLLKYMEVVFPDKFEIIKKKKRCKIGKKKKEKLKKKIERKQN